MSSSPTDSSSSLDKSFLLLERMYMAGVGIGCIAYGIHVTLFLLCLKHLLREHKNRSNRQRARWMLLYIWALFITGSIGNGTQMREMELAYIDRRGGPAVWVATTTEDPVSIAGFAAYVINDWLQDALLLYRFLVIWDYWMPVVIVPSLLLLANMVFGVLLLTQISQPNNTLGQESTVDLGVCYWSTSVTTNFLFTAAIVTRLAWMRFRLRRALGKNTTSLYSSIISMLVESAALYSTIAVAFIITFARNSSLNVLLLPIVGQVSSIAPLLIILRVSQNKEQPYSQRDYTFTKKPHITPGSATLHPSDLTASTSKPSFHNGGHTEALVFSRSREDMNAEGWVLPKHYYY